MKLSVILPCFNGAATLAVQLEALVRQQWPGGWEVVIVNNGSTDASMAIVESYRHRLPCLQIVQAHVPGTVRLGVPHSYNTGIEAAAGDAFVFCEADDEVAPGWLTGMGEALTEHDFVAARLDHRKLNPAWLHPLEGDGYQSQSLSQMDGYPYLAHASGCSFGLRRSLVEQVGTLDVNFPCVHDTEYSWRAQLAGYALHLAPRALIHYREKTSYLARYRQGRAWGRDYLRLVQHYGAPPGRLGLARKLWATRRLPARGAMACLFLAAGRPQGRHLLAQWFWNLGWSVGELQSSARAPVAPRSDVLAVTASAAARKLGAESASPQRLEGSA